MSKEKVPYLCGGVVFSLIKQTVYPSASAAEHYNGVSDRHSDPKMIMDLIFTLSSVDAIKDEKKDKKSPSKKTVSKYINCIENVPKALPFAKGLFISSYDNLVKSHYSTAIEKMQIFIQVHVDPNYYTWLVKAILNIIEQDSDIKDFDQFYIFPDGKPKAKADITHMDQFCLPAVLVGVMHYILLYRGNSNTVGLDTLNKWSTQEQSHERIFNIDSIPCIGRKIEVVFDCPQSATDLNIQEAEIIATETTAEAATDDPTNNSTKEIEPYITSSTNGNRSAILYEKFKEDAQEVLEYLLDNDPTCQPIKRDFPCELNDLNIHWRSLLYKVHDREINESMAHTLNLLDRYAYFLSDKFMRVLVDQDLLIFKNQSWEEGKMLRDELQPKIAELEYALQQQYNKMFTPPETKD